MQKKEAWLFSVMVFDVQMRKKKNFDMYEFRHINIRHSNQIFKGFKKKKIVLGVYYLESK